MYEEIDEDGFIIDSFVDDVCEICYADDGGHYVWCANHVNNQKYDWEIETDQDFDFEIDL